MDKMDKLNIHVENTNDEPIIITTEIINGKELRVRILDKFEHFVIEAENRPVVLDPGCKLNIEYKKCKEE